MEVFEDRATALRLLRKQQHGKSLFVKNRGGNFFILACKTCPAFSVYCEQNISKYQDMKYHVNRDRSQYMHGGVDEFEQEVFCHADMKSSSV